MRHLAPSAKTSAESTEGELLSLSHRGIRDLFLFVMISTAFFWVRNVDVLAPLSESIRVILGAAPPTALTNAALGGYTFSALVLIAGRTANGSRPSMTWQHLFLRSVFYPFYLFSNALEIHFMGAFIAGLLLYGLEQLNIWTYAQKQDPKRAAFGRS